jgi:hypothetical protein
MGLLLGLAAVVASAAEQFGVPLTLKTPVTLKVDEAEPELQKLALMTTSIGREGSVTQRITRVRARVAAAENRLPDAIAGYSELIALPGVAKVMLTRALVERADLYLKTGASDLALADAQRSLELARALQRDKPYSAFTGRALAALSRCQQATAATSEAKVTAGEAAINLAKTLGDDHPDTQWARQAAQL